MAATDKPYRNQNILDIVFGISCGALLLSTLWMFIQDYNRPFKAVQRTFRDVEATMAERDLVDKLPDPADVEAKRKAWRLAQKNLVAARDEVKPVESKLKARRELADADYRGIKAEYDSKMSRYNIAIDDAGKYPAESATALAYTKEAAEIKKTVDDLEKQLNEAKAKLDAIDEEIKTEVRSKVKVAEDKATQADDDLKKLTGAMDRFGKVAAQKAWSVADTVRAWPILDGFASPVKINQIWLNDLTIDYGGFRDVPRYDRCTTCHLGIDRGAYDKATLAKLGDAEENNRLTAKLLTAKEMFEKRVATGEKLGFSPDDLPGEKSGSVGWITLLMLLCVGIAGGVLGVLERSMALAIRTLLIGGVLTFVTAGAIAMFAPRETAVKTIKLKDPEIVQYAVHPRLDLFVDSNSPHSIEKFGCTVCHAGQGSATDFSLATHSPNDTKQTDEWHKEYGYHPSHYWDFPMLPKRFVESSCVKCHYQLTGLVRQGSKEEAPKLMRGYNLVRENGCFGCHEIQGIKSGRQVGPDMRIEPGPALDYLTSAEQERLKADPANPPGTFRKVGPSLRRLAEKTNQEWTTKWINDPRGFREDTKMPHFYNLSTNSKDALHKSAPDQENFPAAEMHAISHYLIAESTNSLGAKDVYRLALLTGKQNLKDLQAQLIKSGLSDRDMKELFDVSKRFSDLALLSAPTHSRTINAAAVRQRQLQERIQELQRRTTPAGTTPADIEAATTALAAAAAELPKVTDELINAAKPVPLASKLFGENGEEVTLPAGGDAGNGRVLFAEKGCLACHSHSGTQSAYEKDGKVLSPAVASEANFGPELSRIADKISPAMTGVTAQRWLVQWLLNPNVYHPRTRMPITHLKVSEASDIATWLLSLKTGWKGKETDPKAPTLKDYKYLAKVYLAKAPGVTKTELETFMGKEGDLPSVPKERMASFARDADELVLEKGKVTADAVKWYIGKKAIGRLGCYACHDIPGFETAKPIGVGLNDWGKKDNDRIAFEDGENFAKSHFSIVRDRITRTEVFKRFVALKIKSKKSLDSAETKAYDQYQKMLALTDADIGINFEDAEKVAELDKVSEKAVAKRADEIAALEKQALDKGLSAKEQETLKGLRELQFFAPLKGKEPFEDYFYQALEHHQREGFLHLKLAEPRSYDYNRIKTWDDRLRMPQFKFARGLRKGATESDADFAARSEKAEAEAREAVMTFILGLVAEPMPLKYVYNPTGDKKDEVLGRAVLDKYNCAGCHQIRPGVFDLKLNNLTLAALDAAHRSALNGVAADHVFPSHSAWTPTNPLSDKVSAVGFFNPEMTKVAEQEGGAVDVVWLTEALRYVGRDRVQKDIPAGTTITLPRDGYTSAGAYGGTFTEMMLPYYLKKTGKPATDTASATEGRSKLPPPLTREGERVQPDWLYKFLLNPGVIRPESYMLLRMPKFNMSSEESRAIVNYFTAVSRLTNPGAGVTAPYVEIEQREAEYWKRTSSQYLHGITEALKTTKETPEAKDRIANLKRVTEEASKRQETLTKLGKELDALKMKPEDNKEAIAKKEREIRDVTSQTAYTTQAYKLLANQELCLKCHNLGTATNIDGAQGPNLALAAERLRPEWMEQWIANPKRMFAYNPVMPQNFPNEADPLKYQQATQALFVGTPRQQTRAVRDLLLDWPVLAEQLRKDPPVVKKDKPEEKK